jgi:transcriptional regulator of NAD metabolism
MAQITQEDGSIIIDENVKIPFLKSSGRKTEVVDDSKVFQELIEGKLGYNEPEYKRMMKNLLFAHRVDTVIKMT